MKYIFEDILLLEIIYPCVDKQPMMETGESGLRGFAAYELTRLQ